MLPQEMGDSFFFRVSHHNLINIKRSRPFLLFWCCLLHQGTKCPPGTAPKKMQMLLREGKPSYKISQCFCFVTSFESFAFHYCVAEFWVSFLWRCFSRTCGDGASSRQPDSKKSSVMAFNLSISTERGRRFCKFFAVFCAVISTHWSLFEFTSVMNTLTSTEKKTIALRSLSLSTVTVRVTGQSSNCQYPWH